MTTDKAGIQIRLDKWLWYARFFKTRSLAARECKAHKIRINGTIFAKSSATVKVGDVLTFPKADDVKVVKILVIGERRGPAPEAQTLYEDLTPPKPKVEDQTATNVNAPSRDKGEGRPTKRDRRAIDKLMAPEEMD